MKKLLIAGFVSSILSTGSAMAAGAQINICSGSESGEYFPTAQKICDNVMGPLAQCKAIVSKGTGDNLTRVESGECSIGLGMNAVVEQHMIDNPGSIKKIAEISMGEVGMAVMLPEMAAALPNWQAIRDNAEYVLLGLPGETSGDALAFKSFQESEYGMVDGVNPLASISPVYDTKSNLIDKVISGEIHVAVMFLRNNPKNGIIEKMSEAGLQIVPVLDPAMVEGYTVKEDVTITDWDISFDTSEGLGAAFKNAFSKPVKMDAGISPIAIFAKEGDASIGTKLASKKLASFDESLVLPKAGWMQKLIDAKEVSGEAFNTAMQKASEIASKAQGLN